MKKFNPFFLLILLPTLLFSQAALGITVNVFSRGPLGGFGDVYAAWTMANKLKAENPNWTVNLIVPERARPGMSTFDPRYNPKTPSAIIGEITVINFPSGTVPRSDFLVQFSAGGEIPAEVARLSRFCIRVDELDSGPASRNPIVFSQDILEFNDVNDLPVFTMTAGMSREAALPGYYVSSQQPKTLTRQEISAYIQTHLNISNLGVTDLITVGYSSRLKPNKDLNPSSYFYIQTISEMARLPENHQRIIHIFFNHNLSPAVLAGLPTNIRFHRFDRLPAIVIDSLMAQSSQSGLPVLTSGDGSLSQALDQEAPFLYELMSWKKGIPRNLMDRIFAGMDPEYRELLNDVWSLPTSSHDFDIATLPVERIRGWARTFADPEFRSQFKNAVQTHRATLSLAKNLGEAIEIIYSSRHFQSFQLPGNAQRRNIRPQLEAIRESIDIHFSPAPRSPQKKCGIGAILGKILIDLTR